MYSLIEMTQYKFFQRDADDYCIDIFWCIAVTLFVLIILNFITYILFMTFIHCVTTQDMGEQSRMCYLSFKVLKILFHSKTNNNLRGGL